MRLKTLSEEIRQLNKFYYYNIFCFTTILLIYAVNNILISDNLYFDFYGEQLSYERIVKLLNVRAKWEWLTYAIIPLYFTLKFSLVALCLSIGVLLTERNVSFKKLFQVALLAETIFLLPSFAKLIWFGVINTDYSLSDLQYFFPLSIFSLMDPATVQPWSIYPLQLLNLFELLYWFVLAYQLKEVLGKSLTDSLFFVSSTYGMGLLLWAIVVAFLTVNLS